MVATASPQCSLRLAAACGSRQVVTCDNCQTLFLLEGIHDFQQTYSSELQAIEYWIKRAHGSEVAGIYYLR
jgi:hypothetical protein